MAQLSVKYILQKVFTRFMTQLKVSMVSARVTLQQTKLKVKMGQKFANFLSRNLFSTRLFMRAFHGKKYIPSRLFYKMKCKRSYKAKCTFTALALSYQLDKVKLLFTQLLLFFARPSPNFQSSTNAQQFAQNSRDVMKT